MRTSKKQKKEKKTAISIRSCSTSLPSSSHATSELYCNIPNSLSVCQLYIIIRVLLYVEMGSGFVTGSLFEPRFLYFVVVARLLSASSGFQDPGRRTQYLMTLYENKKQEGMACFRKKQFSRESQGPDTEGGRGNVREDCSYSYRSKES